MNKQIFNHDNKLWVIHRAIHQSQMNPKGYASNAENTNKMVKVWADWLRDNCKNVQKVLLQNDNFLFCEELESIEEIPNARKEKTASSSK